MQGRLCLWLYLTLTMLTQVSRAFIGRGSVPIRLSKRLSSVGNANSQANSFRRNSISSIEVDASTARSFTGDLIVLPCYSTKSADKGFQVPEWTPEDLKSIVHDVLAEGAYKPEVGTKHLVRLYGEKFTVKHLALVGLGPDPKAGTAGELEVKSASRLGKTIAAIAKEIKAASVGVCLPTQTGNAGVNPILLGIQDALYVDERFKKVPEDGFPQLAWQKLTLLGASQAVVQDVRLTSKLSHMIASGVHFAKDLVGAPPCSKTPVAIAEEIQSMAKEHNLEVKILGQEECEALGMGGYLGVQQGSKFPPRFVHLTYRPDQPSGDVVKVALVGKGLTFDSGGYNLKTGAGSSIELMKFDMGGCAAVFGCAKAIAQLRPKNVEVHFISALCENMVSAEAVRPGDILVASNKKTIEVLNTDAEGRLTLADALVYAEKLNVDRIVDLATLTGASIVGLGERVAALYSPDPALLEDLQGAARRADESVWPMPLEAAYKESIKGSITDLKNIASAKGGGSITAALFLQEFVEKTAWAHIDMAGPVWLDNKPTGFGVKTLVDFLINLKKSK